jgi:hypothetical protein
MLNSSAKIDVHAVSCWRRVIWRWQNSLATKSVIICDFHPAEYFLFSSPITGAGSAHVVTPSHIAIVDAHSGRDIQNLQDLHIKKKTPGSFRKMDQFIFTNFSEGATETAWCSGIGSPFFFIHRWWPLQRPLYQHGHPAQAALQKKILACKYGQ